MRGVPWLLRLYLCLVGVLLSVFFFSVAFFFAFWDLLVAFCQFCCILRLTLAHGLRFSCFLWFAPILHLGRFCEEEVRVQDHVIQEKCCQKVGHRAIDKTFIIMPVHKSSIPFTDLYCRTSTYKDQYFIDMHSPGTFVKQCRVFIISSEK